MPPLSGFSLLDHTDPTTGGRYAHLSVPKKISISGLKAALDSYGSSLQHMRAFIPDLLAFDWSKVMSFRCEIISDDTYEIYGGERMSS